jgi:hypothetical protein
MRRVVMTGMVMLLHNISVIGSFLSFLYNCTDLTSLYTLGQSKITKVEIDGTVIM